MKRKNFCFSNSFIFLFYLFIHNSYATKNKSLELSEPTQEENSLSSLTYIVDDRPVNLKKLHTQTLPEGSIQLVFNGQKLNESFKTENINLAVKQNIINDFLFYFFNEEGNPDFNLKLFEKPSAQFIKKIILSYFNDPSHYNIDNSIMISNDYKIARYHLLHCYYHSFNEDVIEDIKLLTHEIINQGPSSSYNLNGHPFIALINIANPFICTPGNAMLPNPFKLRDNQRFNQSYKKDFYNSVFKNIDYLLSYSNENIVNAYLLVAPSLLPNHDFVNKAYKKYRDKSPILIKAYYFLRDPELKKNSQKYLIELESLIRQDLGPYILSDVYNILAVLSPLGSPQQINYFKLSLKNNYSHAIAFSLAGTYFVDKDYKKSSLLFKNILNNVTDYKEYIFTKKQLLSLYALSLQSLLKEGTSTHLKTETEIQNTIHLLEQQKESLKTHTQLNKQLKEEKHQKKMAQLKEALQECHQQQEQLEKQKQEQLIIQQKQKEQFIKDKQEWAKTQQQNTPSQQLTYQTTTTKKGKQKELTPQQTITQPVAIPTQQTKPKKTFVQSGITIESLIHGNPLKIFNKFFESILGQKTDQQVQISMHEYETLMTALGQEVTSGKGSHKITTYNFQHLDEKLENKILALAKHTDLLPYQIKQIRENFLDYGLYPKDLISHLINKGFLEK